MKNVVDVIINFGLPLRHIDILSKILSQGKNFVKSVTTQYGNPDSHPFLFFKWSPIFGYRTNEICTSSPT